MSPEPSRLKWYCSRASKLGRDDRLGSRRPVRFLTIAYHDSFETRLSISKQVVYMGPYGTGACSFTSSLPFPVKF